MKAILISISVITILVISCKKGGNDKVDTAGNFNRQNILINMADSLIIPSYQDFQVKADAMEVKVKALTDNPSLTTLSEARLAWKNAYVAWQKIALWDFGPAMTQSFISNANTYPTNTTSIESIIAGGAYDLASPFSKSIQGFPAIEFLLYGNNKTNAEIVASFSNTSKVSYINVLTKRITDINKSVTSAWTTSYRQSFINASGVDLSSSLGQLFNNTFLPYIEVHNREAKFGIPGGQRTGTPLPGNAEGYYSRDFSKELALASLNAYKAAWYGTGFTTNQSGSSLNNYLIFMDRKNSTGFASQLATKFQTIESKINALPASLRSAAEANPASLNEVWMAYQQMVVQLKTDVASALSITVAYADTDGD
ncbi:MAG TPA: imelysin family protein [Pedobacter sp.]